MNNVKVRNLKGENGGVYIADTAAHAGDFDAIFAHEAAVIEALVSSNIAGSLAAVKLPAGATWFGRFSSVKLTSGSVTAYTAA